MSYADCWSASVLRVSIRERHVESRHAISQVSGLQVSVAQRGLHRGVPQDLPHLGERSPRLDHPRGRRVTGDAGCKNAPVEGEVSLDTLLYGRKFYAAWLGSQARTTSARTI